MINLILFGPPGCGKGTQAINLVEKYNLLHISTGDLFRYELSNNTELGEKARAYMAQGQLVPDEITIAMLLKKVDKHPDVKGYIFDGFPRTVAQAEALDAKLHERGQQIDALIALEVGDDEIVKRILERGKTSGRTDDNDEGIIRTRIEVYKNDTTPVFEYYKTKDKSHSINGIGSIEDIFQRLSDVIDNV